MRFRSQAHGFLGQHFDLDALPSPPRELPREQICIHCFRNEAAKLQLARQIFSEPQLASIVELKRETLADFLKVVYPLLSRAKPTVTALMIFKTSRTVVDLHQFLPQAGSGFFHGRTASHIGLTCSEAIIANTLSPN
jgi:hypothetical protein